MKVGLFKTDFLSWQCWTLPWNDEGPSRGSTPPTLSTRSEKWPCSLSPNTNASYWLFPLQTLTSPHSDALKIAKDVDPQGPCTVYQVIMKLDCFQIFVGGPDLENVCLQKCTYYYSFQSTWHCFNIIVQMCDVSISPFISLTVVTFSVLRSSNPKALLGKKMNL